MFQQGKTIYIISQQDWGKMFVSKHHYAVTLAAMGNKVFFIDSPDQEGQLKKGKISIVDTQYENLKVVRHRFSFPYIFKFKAKGIFKVLVNRHIKKIVKSTSGADVVWSFDLSNTLPLKYFPSTADKIYMVADLPGNETLDAVETADMILSTNFSDDFLQKEFASIPVYKKFANHAVAEKFIVDEVSDEINSIVQVGMSGNFLRPDIDWDVLFEIVSTNKNVHFNIWGPTGDNEGNLGASEKGLDRVQKLKALDNVKLHGVVTSDVLANKLKTMDAFLICYDPIKDQSRGTNYHKVLEYMASGKVIISSNISAYSQTTGVVEMVKERNNKNLPDLFSKIIGDLSFYNSKEKQEYRVSYAKAHTYKNNIIKIQNWFKEHSAR